MTNVKVTLAKKASPRKITGRQSSYAALSAALRDLAKLRIPESAAVWREIKALCEKNNVSWRDLRIAPVRVGGKVKKIDILRPQKQNERLFITIIGSRPDNISLKVIPVKEMKKVQSSFTDFRKLFVQNGGTASQAGSVWKQLEEQAGVASSELFVEDDGPGKISIRKQGKGSARILVANVKVEK